MFQNNFIISLKTYYHTNFYHLTLNVTIFGPISEVLRATILVFKRKLKGARAESVICVDIIFSQILMKLRQSFKHFKGVWGVGTP
jgi:hypothetical protein